MTFDEVINKRRSIRKYLSDPVKDEDIKNIIEAGMLAPSAHNRQPWKIFIAKDEIKTKIYEAMLSKKDINSSIEMTANIINEVPVLLVIFYEPTDEPRDNDILSIGAFIENMHLKATSLSLGSLWIANTNHIKNEIKNIMGTNLECVSCLAIGYKDQDPKERPRKTFEEIIVK